jgi:hypothetical protein
MNEQPKGDKPFTPGGLSIEDRRELSDRLEEPLPELRAHMYPEDNGSWTIHHPLCVQPSIDPDRCALWNHQFLKTKKEVEEAEGDWHGYVFRHCRGYRFDAFKRIARRLGSADYWKLLRDVWIDSEAP